MGHEALLDMCFVMFVDRKTLDAEFTRNSSIEGRRLGIWRLVVVEHLPYTDMRLSGVVSTQTISSHGERVKPRA